MSRRTGVSRCIYSIFFLTPSSASLPPVFYQPTRRRTASVEGRAAERSRAWGRLPSRWCIGGMWRVKTESMKEWKQTRDTCGGERRRRRVETEPIKSRILQGGRLLANRFLKEWAKEKIPQPYKIICFTALLLFSLFLFTCNFSSHVFTAHFFFFFLYLQYAHAQISDVFRIPDARLERAPLKYVTIPSFFPPRPAGSTVPLLYPRLLRLSWSGGSKLGGSWSDLCCHDNKNEPGPAGSFSWESATKRFKRSLKAYI